MPSVAYSALYQQAANFDELRGGERVTQGHPRGTMAPTSLILRQLVRSYRSCLFDLCVLGRNSMVYLDHCLLVFLHSSIDGKGRLALRIEIRA